MLGFVNIESELSFQSKYGIPTDTFALEYSLKDTPLDFQYTAAEAVSAFIVVKVDNVGNIIETVVISTSLITYSDGQHICTGLVNYASPLDCGLYYFLVNSKYQSDYFQVLQTMEESIDTNLEISVSGLGFQDSDFGIVDFEKIGTPFIKFGIQYAKNITPLDFSYLADEAISSFVAIRIDNNYNTIETITIETSLITYANGKHTCTGLVDFVTPLECGNYYFLINGHYQSDIFGIVNLENVIAANCLQLFGGGNLELFGGGCLELFE